MITFMNLMVSHLIIFSPSLRYLRAHLKHQTMLSWLPGDKSWIKIRPIFGASFVDVVYYNNKFYCVDSWEEFSPATLEAQILL